MNRLDLWSEKIRSPALIETRDDDIVNAILKDRKITNYFDDTSTTIDSILLSCKEIIFGVSEEGNVEFNLIGVTLDTYSFEYITQHVLSVRYEDESEEDLNQEVLSFLGRSTMAKVPVYPNNKECKPLLLSYYKKLYRDGFKAKDENNNYVNLVNPSYQEKRKGNLTALLSMEGEEFLNPIEREIIKEVIDEKLSKLSRAEQVLTKLEVAIKELEYELKNIRGKEEDLQKCLTKNPILFGLEYNRAISKHRFGTEYISDYALEKYSGQFDVVEIEKSTHKIYNKNGNPSAALTHAEQQVLDWLEWIARNISYANANLPGITSPHGFIIIGRDQNDNDFNKKLNRRNITFKNSITILSYDMFLSRAKQMLDILSKQH